MFLFHFLHLVSLFAFVLCQSPQDAFPALSSGQLRGLGSALKFGDSVPSLLKRQTETCPANAPVDCGAPGCCLAGQHCCSPSGCCDTGDNCVTDGCCPETANTCNRGYCLNPSETCCGTGACEEGYECQNAVNGGQGCCLPGSFACDEEFCCPEGSTCYGTGLCKSTTLTQTTIESVSTATSTSFKMSYSTSYFTQTQTYLSESVSDSTSTSTQTSTSTSSFSAICTPSIGAQASSSDNTLQQLCNGIPVMFFPLIPGRTEELIESICNAGLGDQVVLTWAGDGGAGADRRRAKVGCRGYCAGLGQSVSTTYNGPNECDEFPFASTLEGGTPSTHKQCIYWRQNKIGGSFIQNYARIYSLQPGQQFVVKIVPGCPASPPSSSLTTRQATDANLHDELHEFWRRWWDGLELVDESGLWRRQTSTYSSTNTSDGFIDDLRPGSLKGAGFNLAPMFDVPGGTTVNFTLSPVGKAAYLAVIDSDGIDYYYSNDPPSQITFNLEGATNDTTNLAIVASYAASTDASSIYYSATATPSSSTASGGGGGGGGGVSSAMNLRPPKFLSIGTTWVTSVTPVVLLLYMML